MIQAASTENKHQIQSSQRVYLLDSLRSIAAFCVLLGHWRAMFFVDWKDVDSKNPLLTIFYAVTGFGHEAVLVFFVLSGYLIGSTIVATKEHPHFWGNYLISRLLRLYIVIIPALALTFFVDSLGLALFGGGGVYSGQREFGALMLRPIDSGFAADVFLGNLFFLQTIVVPIYGSNAPMWSLSNEFWYYIIFPLLLLSASRRYILVIRFFFLILAVGILVFVGKDIRFYFLSWLLGVLIVYCPKNFFPKSILPAIAGLLLFLTLLANSRVNQGSSVFANEMLPSVGFAVLLWTFRNTYLWNADGKIMRAAGWISDRSFSIYAYHAPLLVFARAWFSQETRIQPTLAGFLWPSACLLGTIAIIIVLAQCTEVHFIKVRRWILTRISKHE